MTNRIKIAISGSAGQIGYALLFRIASGQMFGQDTDLELHLLDLEQSLPALEGVAMELEDCAFPLLKKFICTSSLKEAMDGVNWVILVGAFPRKQGMERSDLLQINGGIFTQQGNAINAYAANNVRTLVVGNPCNTNCLITMHNAPDVPKERFYAMTTLDELRARAQLALKAQVDITAVTQMTIWGNHSATQYPDFYNAKINGIAASEVIADETWLKETFVSLIQQRGATIIKARNGLSSAASAANAIIKAVNLLTRDTPNHESFSMGVYSQGEYGINNGLIASLPCRTIDNKVHVMDNLYLNEYAQAKLATTMGELQQERDTVQALGFLSMQS